MSAHVRDLIVRRLERDLSNEEADRVRRHVIGCVGCATYAREIVRLEGVLRSAGRPPVRPPARSRSAVVAAVIGIEALIAVAVLAKSCL